MKHAILGEVEQSDGHPFDAVAMIRQGSRDIKVGIIRDDQPLETTLNLAAEVVIRLAELDKLAKRVAARDLREGYNDGWNEYDEAQDDGPFKRVSNPKLSEAEFEANGRQYEARGSACFPPLYREGDSVPVYYPRDRPDRGQIVTGRESAGAWLCLAFGIVFGLFALAIARLGGTI